MSFKKAFSLFFVFTSILVNSQSVLANTPEILGDLQQWHTVTLLFDGPVCSETGTPNPFTDYRLNVAFIQGKDTLRVPGHFAVDGKAAYTSANEGNKWRVNFLPSTSGTWKYEVSFRKGSGIAMSKMQGESGDFMDGVKGSLEIAEGYAKNGFIQRGKLQYVDEHYLQFQGHKTYFIKCGADAPENLLAYEDFDATPNVGNRRKSWAPHQSDYNKDADAFLWGPDHTNGKNLLGAINYLSVKGLNAFSFLTFNVDGDDRNVFPHLLKTPLQVYEDSANNKDQKQLWENMVIHDRFDVSKMDQWEQVFRYGDEKGMFMHFKTQETENDHKMDGGALGDERKLYYRELISRFGHHLAMTWNLGEENTQSTQQVEEMAEYFAENDPYNSPIVLHTYPEQHEKVYRPLLGNKNLDGLSIQTKNSDFSLVHDAVVKWLAESEKSGKKWVVGVDEPGDASHALLPDAEDSLHNNARINGLWGTLLAGGYGTEWYFGYKHPESDLTCEDWRSRDLFWDQCKIALDFFHVNSLPLLEMESLDTLTESENDFVFGIPDEVYLVYSKSGEPIEIELSKKGYEMEWLNPRTGEVRFAGKSRKKHVILDCPTKSDWLLMMRQSK